MPDGGDGVNNLAHLQAQRLFGSPQKPDTSGRVDYAQGWTAGHTAGETASHQRARIAAADARQATKRAREAGYAEGYESATREIRANLARYVADLLGRADEIGRNAHAEARKTSEAWRQQRVAEFEMHAVNLHTAMGRPPGWDYRGGPVDWNTGLPQEAAA